MSQRGTALIAALQSSGRCVTATAVSRPPFEPPMTASLGADVYLSATSFSATAYRSSKTFCLRPIMPASCQVSPYSPPPRRFATT